MSSNPNVGKVFNLTGGGGGSASLKLESLTITKPPNKTFYKSGENFDPDGMVVTAGYNYGITSAVTGYTVSPSVLTDGVKEVTITYTEGRVTKTATTPVTVEKVLASIEVTRNPTKMTYNYLEKFNPNGMVVTARFSDNSIAPATGYTYPSTGFTTLGPQVVNLAYTYESVTKSTSLTVTVNPIELAVPTQKGAITYDGATKTPSWNGYDSIKMSVSGQTEGVNAGTYTVKFTLSYGYVFPGGLSEVSVTWVIGKAANTISVSPESLTLNETVRSSKLLVTRKGNGTITAISSDMRVAAVGTINQTSGEIEIKSVNATSGTAKITIKVAESANYFAPANKEVEVRTSFYAYFYGYDLDISDSNPATRVSYPADVDNSGFTAAKMTFGGSFSYGSWPDTPGQKFMPRPCMLLYSGIVDYYLNPDDYTEKAEGGSSDVANIGYDGNAMMEWPKIYVKRWESGGVYHFRCSDARVDDGYECWSNYDKDNHEIPHFYTPIFFGSKDSSNRLRSISDQLNVVSQNARTEIEYAKANGDDWYTEVAADRFLLQDLLVMMFKSTDLQAALGDGVCGSKKIFITPGSMNTKGLFWGSKDEVSGVKAFGMENPWGNVSRRIAGWIYMGGAQKLKLTRGTKDGTTVNDYNTDGDGYKSIASSTISGNGFISGMKTEAFGRLPITASGSSTTYEPDYVYKLTDTGSYYSIVGGYMNDNLSGGPFCVYFIAPDTHASEEIGAALSCKPAANELNITPVSDDE